MDFSKKLEFSKEVRFQEVEKDVFVGWNRFSPHLLRLNKEAVDFLKNIKDEQVQKQDVEKLKPFKIELLNHKFIYQGRTDPSQDFFFKLIDDEYDRIKRRADEFYETKQDYSQLYICNDFCNLKCSYCVKNYKHVEAQKKSTNDEKLDMLKLVVEQYVHRKLKNNATHIPICFNGGEILLEWDLIKNIVRSNQKEYPGTTFKYFINTNMTLMTEEIAKFMGRYDFDVDISIDGYPEAHNLTRIYKDGKGSFDDVIKGTEIYRKYNKNSPIKSFQGTVENPDNFKVEEVFNMRRFGFKSARLAPNLLNVSEKNAKQKAQIMGRLIKLNLVEDFQVSDSYFENIRKLLKLQNYKFYLNCVGLCGLPRMGLYFNVSTLKVSQLCSYLSQPALHLKTIGYDIYNPSLWKVSLNFIKQRLNALKTYCIDCDMVGICKGDCVMSGLDVDNQPNKPACLYQKEMWKLFLTHMYSNEMDVEEIH